MVSKKITEPEYFQWLAEIKDKIRNSKLRAGLKVNTELLSLYWELGKAMTDKQANSTWGDKVITQLAADLTAEFKDLEGFSRSNLFNIRKWYQFYAQNLPLVQHQVGLMHITDNQHDAIVQRAVGLFPTALAVIPWGHHIQIITKTKSVEEAIFYIQQTAAHNWPKPVLVHQIDSGLYYRRGKAQTNFEVTLPKPQSELAKEIMKNPYNLDFLNLSEEVNERDLENAILSNIKKFLLELGVGFSFYGQQFHVKVGEKDFYIDLIFYHARLHCYFVIELKVTDFEPEHIGKLDFYITAIDEQLKLPEDNPTIGLLLCKTADKVIVEYSLRSKTKPMGIAEYKHIVPKEWKNDLPDEKLLKQELEKEIIIPQKSSDEKIERLKEIIKKINADPADIEKDGEIIKKIFSEIQVPLITMIDERLIDIKPMFKNCKIEGRYNHNHLQWNMHAFDLEARILLEENIWVLGFEFFLQTFIHGGTKAFNIRKGLDINLEKHRYMIGPDKGNIWYERVYRRMLTRKELEEIADRFVESVVEEANMQAEQILNA